MRLDWLDHAIISELQDDATVSLWTLAARCGSSEPTVRRRVAWLRKQDVMRVVAVVDPFRQGYPVVAIINLPVDQRPMPTVKVALARMKHLRFAGITVGTDAYDWGQQRAAEPPPPDTARARRAR